MLRGFFKPSSSMNSPTRQGQMDVPIIVKRFKSFVLSECRDQLMVWRMVMKLNTLVFMLGRFLFWLIFEVFKICFLLTLNWVM